MASNRLGAVSSWLAEAARSNNEPVTNGLLCRSACERLGVDGVSVTLMAPTASDGGVPARGLHQEPVAAAGMASSRLEELHLTTGEGPSTAAFTDAVSVLVPDLEAATPRWPGLAPAALGDGIAAIFAFPLHIGTYCPGVLTAHRNRPGVLAPQHVADAGVYAEIAACLLRTDPTQPLTSEMRRDTGSANRRDEVHQAVGMVAVQLGLGMRGAFDRLRAHAYTHERELSEVARDVVAGRLYLRGDD